MALFSILGPFGRVRRGVQTGLEGVRGLSGGVRGLSWGSPPKEGGPPPKVQNTPFLPEGDWPISLGKSHTKMALKSQTLDKSHLSLVQSVWRGGRGVRAPKRGSGPPLGPPRRVQKGGSPPKKGGVPPFGPPKGGSEGGVRGPILGPRLAPPGVPKEGPRGGSKGVQRALPTPSES